MRKPKDREALVCSINHDDPDGIPKFLCRFCNPKLNTSREEWLENLRNLPMAAKSDFLKMQEKLAELNTLRSQRGIDAIKHWRASYEGLLEAIEECKKKIEENKALHKQVHAGKAPAAKATPAAKEKAAPVPKVEKAAPVPVKPGTAAAFNQMLKNREGTNQEKLATFVFNNIGKKLAVDKIAAAVYGKEAKKKGDAIHNAINGFAGKLASVKGYKVEKSKTDLTLKKG